MRVGIARNALIGADRAAGLIIVEQRGEIDFCRLVLQSVADAAYGAAVGVRRTMSKRPRSCSIGPSSTTCPWKRRRIAVEAAGLVYRRGIVFENLPGKLGAGKQKDRALHWRLAAIPRGLLNISSEKPSAASVNMAMTTRTMSRMMPRRVLRCLNIIKASR